MKKKICVISTIIILVILIFLIFFISRNRFSLSIDGNKIDKEEFCIGDLNKESLEEIWNSQRHKEVKEASNRKWMEGACKNCRAISYNRIINETIDQMPAYFDPFI